MPVMCPHPSHMACIELLRQLAPLRHVFLMGGFAEDAVFNHEITQDRSDLDMLAKEEMWPDLREQLLRAGIGGFAPIFSDPRGNPVAYRSTTPDLPVEVWLATPQPHGYAIILPGGASVASPTAFRLLLPADTFRYPATTLEGVPVQTISPLALCLFRATSAQTRGSPQERARDMRLVDRLAQAYLQDRDRTDLTPELTELSGS
jgi:hypothetical protein